METIKVGIFVGSLREGSYSRQVAKAVAAMLPRHFKTEIIEMGELPLYNEDLDAEGAVPAAWQAFRDAVKAQQAFLFVTPEYNRSVPAVLKNALDVASRPYGESVWDAKPGAVISVSPGKQGAFGANHHLRQCMSFLNVYMMQQPEAYVGDVTSILGENGAIQLEGSRQFLQSVADAFAAWVARFTG